MYKRTIQSRRQKRTYRGGVDIDDPYDKADLSSVEHASKPVSPSANPENKKKRGRSSESDREQTDQSRPQPAAKRLKLDGEHDSQAEASDKQSRGRSFNDDLPKPDLSPQPAIKQLKPNDISNSISDESRPGSTGTKSDTSSDQLTSASSHADDTSTSSSEEDDTSTPPPPSYFPCGYLRSANNPSHVIHLKMNRFGGWRQTFIVGYDNSCDLHVEGRQVEPLHCAIRLKVDVDEDGTVTRQVLARGLKTVKGAETTIKTSTDMFLLEPKDVELSDGDLIRFGKGTWFRCRKPEFHQLYCEVEQVHGGKGANSTVVRVRRGHDDVECIAKAITADHDGMAVTELLAYEALGRHSNIVRLLESFFNKNSKIHHLVLEPATTDLSRFVARMRAHSQADLRVAASVWTKQIVSAVYHLHSLDMSHRDMKPKNILVFVTGAERIEVKLADFGLVRLESERVKSNWVWGTPGWRPPAAFWQFPDDRLVDCYGVGRILFFLLTAHEWPSEPDVPGVYCGCADPCPESCVRREAMFRHIKHSGANSDCLGFLRKVLVCSPEMCAGSKEMAEHSYVSYVPLESEQARIDSAIARLNSQFNRLSHEI